MSLIIRKAVADDCFAIAEIIKDSMGFENSPALIRENLEKILIAKADLVLIAEYDNQPVGFIHAEDYNALYSPQLKEIMSLAVKKQYQHMKIGTELIAQVEKWAAETGRKGIQVLSRVEFSDAHRFYQSLNYMLNKTQMNFIKYF